MPLVLKLHELSALVALLEPGPVSPKPSRAFDRFVSNLRQRVAQDEEVSAAEVDIDAVLRAFEAKARVSAADVNAVLRDYHTTPRAALALLPFRERIERLRALAARRLRSYERAAQRLARLKIYADAPALLECLRELKRLQAAPLVYGAKRTGRQWTLTAAPRRRKGKPGDAWRTSLVAELQALGMRRALARDLATAHARQLTT